MPRLMRWLFARAGGSGPAPDRRKRKARARPARRWRIPRPRTPRAFGLLAAVAALVVGVAVWKTGAAAHGAAWLEREAIAVSVAAGLAVDEVFIVGRREAPLKDLRESLGVARGDPMLRIDPAQMRERLEANPWVAAARVERRWPDILHIRIVERRPMALWQHRGALGVVDRDGRVLTRGRVERYAALPLIVGEGAPAALPSLLAAMSASAELSPRLSAASWVGGRRWTLRFDDRIDVLMPEGPPAAAWKQLEELQRRAAVLDAGLKRIDLRGGDRVLVRLDESAAAESRT